MIFYSFSHSTLQGFEMTAQKLFVPKKAKGFARALKLDIGKEKDVAEEKWVVLGGRSLLMNRTRQNIFRYLCEYPCSTLSTVAKDFELSPASISWHLNLLLDRHLISDSKVGGQRVFYPNNMIDESVIPILALLAKPKIQTIFIKIGNIPGIKQKELCEALSFGHQSINTFTNQLEDMKLITIVRDGKFRRYYPTDTLDQLKVLHRKILKEFRTWVIKSFKTDGVNPKIIRVTDRVLFLQITSGTSVGSLRLSVNPFGSIIQNKAQFLKEL